MQRLFILFLVVSSSVFLFPAIVGCASGGNSTPRRRDGGLDHPIDARPPSMTSVDSGRAELDAAIRPADAAHIIVDSGRAPLDAATVPLATRESCNGLDDDLDSRIDEDFLCPLGRMGEICVTSCGANGYRECEAPSCSWSTSCHTFAEVCDDTLDNDCNGLVDDGCPANPGTGWVCEGDLTRIHLEPNPSLLGPCSRGWTLILWGAGGASEPYASTPGASLDVTIRDDWLGWAAFTAYCGDWSGVRNWTAFEGRLSSEAGVTVTIDSDAVPVRVCYDPGGSIIRPLVPVQCGLAACPGPSY